MFRFSANQRHALRHGLQDFGKLTLAVLFLGSSLGFIPLKVLHPESEASFSKTLHHQSKPKGTGLRRPVVPFRSRFNQP